MAHHLVVFSNYKYYYKDNCLSKGLSGSEAFLKYIWLSWQNPPPAVTVISKAIYPSTLTVLSLQYLFVNTDRMTWGGNGQLSVNFAIFNDLNHRVKNGQMRAPVIFVLMDSCISANRNSQILVAWSTGLPANIKACSLYLYKVSTVRLNIYNFKNPTTSPINPTPFKALC